MNHVPVINADVGNHASLNAMARRTRIVLNCVGPFLLYGEPVVKACIDESTHYVDITAEPHFIENMAVKYHEEAEAKGVFVVSTCGLDCISTDMAVVFLQQNFKGVLNTVELYGKVWEKSRPTPGPLANNGTWKSVVLTISNWKFKTLFQQLTKKQTGRQEVHQK